jgi:subtilisin family serine protease
VNRSQKARPVVKTSFFCPDFWNVTNIMIGKQSCGRFLLVAGVAASMVVWLTTSASAQPAQPAYREDRILIMPKAGINLAALDNFHLARKGEVLRTFDGIGHLQVLHVPQGETVSSLISKYQKSGLVEFAEPDYVGHVYDTKPNETSFANGTLWGLTNISAAAAWDVLTSASNIVVAVVDTGVRYTHEDLASNMWVNPVDGSHGWNAINGNNNPNDNGGFTISHGTLVAGVIGAVGNNGKGVVGVAWRLQIMACQWLNNYPGSGTVSDCITCLDYARTNGARIVNASWGFPTNSLALSNAIVSLRTAGIILVAACGNSTTNIDTNPTYPSGLQLDNIVSVAATTSNDTLSAYSNYGATNVLLAAPGDNIYSTVSATDSYYGYGTGTSMAAPYVSGACALLMAQYPADSYQQIIRRLLSATDPLPSLAGKCRTGGRLNLRKALRTILVATIPATNVGPFQLRVSGGLNRTCSVEATTNLADWSPIFTNTTSTNGTFDFADDQSTNLPQRFFRATAAP